MLLNRSYYLQEIHFKTDKKWVFKAQINNHVQTRIITCDFNGFLLKKNRNSASPCREKCSCEGIKCITQNFMIKLDLTISFVTICVFFKIFMENFSSFIKTLEIPKELEKRF